MRAPIEDRNAAAYIPEHLVHARFGELERLMRKATSGGDAAIVPEHTEEKLNPHEAQVQTAVDNQKRKTAGRRERQKKE
ncbi:hypothetical protein [Shimia isoporae]|uniref:hypothetical protein n=1 Tax=Shimia isoporae TaxID=647720 RepID=UPI0014054BD6|nr:hypothetical protein [Shimia isoporae]